MKVTQSQTEQVGMGMTLRSEGGADQAVHVGGGCKARCCCWLVVLGFPVSFHLD